MLKSKTGRVDAEMVAACYVPRAIRVVTAATQSAEIAAPGTAFWLAATPWLPRGARHAPGHAVVDFNTGYSVVVIPVQIILSPNKPYALKSSHAVWSLSSGLLVSGAITYFGAAMIRRDTKGTLIKSGLTGGIGLMLQGVAMDLAKHHRSVAIVVYYVGQLLFGGAYGLSTLAAQ